MLEVSPALLCRDGSSSMVNAMTMCRWVAETVARMSLPEKVGQLFTSCIDGYHADTPTDANTRDFGVATPADVVRTYHLGGVIYLRNGTVCNIEHPRQVASLSNGLQQAATGSGAGIPLNISTDQEAGIVSRIPVPATTFPGSMALAAGGRIADARHGATISGRELRAIGITVNYAPDADVNSDPANPVIGVRAFGSDPATVARFVAAQVAGYQRHVSATAKHFPGHGNATADSHHELPVVPCRRRQWLRRDAPPFRAAIAAGVDMIMTAHLTLPGIDPSGEPATLSPAILGLLRDELHYDGVVITDSLRMAGVRTRHPDAELPVLALLAGADVLLMPAQLDTAIGSVIDAVRTGRLPEQRIDRSVTRVLRQKYRNGVMAKPFVALSGLDGLVGRRQHQATARRIAERTITVLHDGTGLLPLRVPPARVLVTGWGEATTATLAQRIRMRGPHVIRVHTGDTPHADQIAQACAAAGDAGLVIALTCGAASQPAQRALLHGLQRTGTPVAAVAVRNPYDAGSGDAGDTWLATYGHRRSPWRRW